MRLHFANCMPLHSDDLRFEFVSQHVPRCALMFFFTRETPY